MTVLRQRAEAFVSLASDIALVLDASGVVLNVAQGGAAPLAPAAHEWIGRAWVDTVTGDTRAKVHALLKDMASTGIARRREVNHPSATGVDIPVAYTAMQLGEHGPVLVVGRDLRAVAAIQQRFVDAQREMERGYWRTRQSESRYRLLFQVANDAFFTLARRTQQCRPELGELADLFTEPAQARRRLTALARERTPWRGELALALDGGARLPVTVRAELVPSRDGSAMGFFLILEDLTESQRAAAARRQLEQSLSEASRDQLIANAQARGKQASDDLISAILANASLAAMDIADGGATPAVAPLLEELEASTKRAAALYERVRTFNAPR